MDNTSSPRHLLSETHRNAERLAQVTAVHGFGNHIAAALIAGSPRVEEFIADHPNRLRTDYHYRVEIDADAGHSVQTSYASCRMLADADCYAVYICRSYAAISKVIADKSIIGLEVAEIDLALWRNACKGFAASLAINGRQDATLAPDGTQVCDDWVRFTFSRSGLPGDLTAPIALTVLTSYRLAPDARRFPVKFANHFTVGGLRVDIMIRSQSPVRLSHAEYIAGLLDGGPIPKGLVYERARTPQARAVEASVSLGPDVLVWPGSGIEFFWSIETL